MLLISYTFLPQTTTTGSVAVFYLSIMSEKPTNPVFIQAIKVAHPFTGSTRSVFTLREFLLSLDLKFGLHQITDDFRKICIFADNIGGKATQWFLNFSASHDLHTTSYSTLVSQFTDSFGAQLNTYDISRKICSLAQRNSIDGYIKEFYQYKNLLPEDAMSEPVLVSYFVKGLKPDTRKAVVLQSPTTLYEATELARRCEHCLLDPISINFSGDVSPDTAAYSFDSDGDTVMAIRSAHRRGYSTQSKFNTSSRRGRFNNSHKTKVSSNIQSNSRDKEDIRRLCLEYKLCFKCRKPGHQSTSCPNASSL